MIHVKVGMEVSIEGPPFEILEKTYADGALVQIKYWGPFDTQDAAMEWGHHRMTWVKPMLAKQGRSSKPFDAKGVPLVEVEQVYLGDDETILDLRGDVVINGRQRLQ